MLHLNKEIKLNLCDKITSKYGTTNYSNPQVIYITCKTWIIPTYDGEYELSMKEIRKKFKKNVSRMIYNSKQFMDKFIFDFDTNTSNLIHNKKKYISFSIYMRQKPNKTYDLKDLKPFMIQEFGYLLRELENEFIINDFELSKTKK